MSAPQLPPAALIVSHTVADWDVWKAAFDNDKARRRASGVLAHHLNRGRENSNLVSAYLAVADVSSVKALLGDPAMQRVMEAAGVTSVPDLTWVTPAHERVVWDRELPAQRVSHSVADFDAWLEVYMAFDPKRKQLGIIGDAVNRGLDDPNFITVYNQAESFEALEAFAASAELKEAMGRAGVTSLPSFSYHRGGWAEMY